MPEYLSPGVYVEEVPSAVKPIAGVSTSTAAFVGIVPDQIEMVDENPDFDPTQPTTDPTGSNSPYHRWTFPLTDDSELRATRDRLRTAQTEFETAKGNAAADPKAFRQAHDRLSAARSALGRATAHTQAGDMADTGKPVLCTSFSDFKRNFGDFSLHGLPGAPAAAPAAGPAPAAPPAPGPGQSQLAHGVFGFFNNGGTRCYVMRFKNLTELQGPEALAPLEAVDEISLVVAPGITDPVVQTNVITHCTNMSDRFAILDGPQNPADLTAGSIKLAPDTDYGALYFPWVKVFDIVKKLTDPDGDGEVYIGPSGLVAGVYARVDDQRGVHKAPANEVVRGALEAEYQISRSLQNGLNPGGVNCLRVVDRNVVVWGARTIGGDANADLKYVNVRRVLIFLRKSIDEGTQWVVFEPNDRTLWAKIVRNVTAFLTTVWRAGALFGSTPQEAFYVKCDDETNPPEERDLGRVTTEIGVAIVRPAEFVIFRIMQWAGPQSQ